MMKTTSICLGLTKRCSFLFHPTTSRNNNYLAFIKRTHTGNTTTFKASCRSSGSNKNVIYRRHNHHHSNPHRNGHIHTKHYVQKVVGVDTGAGTTNTGGVDFYIVWTLSTRILMAFGIAHIFSEYGFEMTLCEGPSMMPTINPRGEIILIEKMSHRIYGLDHSHCTLNNNDVGEGDVNVVIGDDAELRAKYNREKQLQWQKEESEVWLTKAVEAKKEIVNQHHKPLFNNSKSNDENIDDIDEKSTTKEQREKEDGLLKSVHEQYEHTWFQPMLKEANKQNYHELSSWRNCYKKMTSGICVGDVIVVRHPDRDTTVCKRVLGLPGDIIIRPKSNNFYRGRRHSRHREIIDRFYNNSEDNDEQTHGLIKEECYMHNVSLLTVPSGYLWIEGDNSINSHDSRNYGPIPASLVVGKVCLRLWPLKGQSIIVRGSAPLPAIGMPFCGSTRLPAGYEGESLRHES